MWRALAWLASRPRVVEWLIARAARTPYAHIVSADGSLYMGRWWLFNPYRKDADGHTLPARWQWLPSIRLHHIMRPDRDRHLHDHPWNARTIILRGSYKEERKAHNPALPGFIVTHSYRRKAGYTGTLKFGEYHRIAWVADGGAWTLFFTWRKQGTWGFWVNGRKVPSRTYLGIE